MTRRRTQEDLLHPERVLFRLLQDYSTGILQNRPNSTLLRARVEDVDHEGGRIESSPPNPPNSIRARVYTSGMDFNLPPEMLTVFYPLGNLRPAVEGEHVMVMFEDVNQTSGYWLGVMPQRFDVNYTNPDESIASSSSGPSQAFGESSATQRQPNPILQYGGLIDGTSTETQQRIVEVVETQTNRWSGKNVLLIGDSQMQGPPGIALQNFLREHGVVNIVRDGRQGWGVGNWLSGRLHSTDAAQPGLDELISQNNPDIVVIMLGGNDGSSRRALRSDYENRVRELWNMTQGLSGFSIWCGPPTAVGDGAGIQPLRDIATQKIRNVVGSRNFVDCRTITNTTTGRRPDGVHFLSSSPAIQPWIELIYNTGNSL